ncbi:MAG TPA: GAF domain-containing protein, partial [Caldilinea sp.]|nr:GAF domain-containing protein [Caldilinea sp.]
LLQLLLETPAARDYQNLIGIGILATDEPSALFARLHRLWMWAVDAGQPLFFDPAQQVDSPEDLYYNETGRALMAPITLGDSPLGALYIESPPNTPGYDEEDMVVLRTAANAFVIALQQLG